MIISYPQQAGFYWGAMAPKIPKTPEVPFRHPTAEEIKVFRDNLLDKLSQYGVLILNDGNVATITGADSYLAWPEIIGLLKLRNPKMKIYISFNIYSTFYGPDGNSSPYWPLQVAMTKFVTSIDGWLKARDGSHIIASKERNQHVFDIRIPAVREKYVELVDAFMAGLPAADGRHYDESHYTIRFLQDPRTGKTYPPEDLPTDAEWNEAMRLLLRRFEYPVMVNGTYDLATHNTPDAAGHYEENISNAQGNDPATIMTRYLKDFEKIALSRQVNILKGISPLTPTDIACFSAIMGTHYQWRIGPKGYDTVNQTPEIPDGAFGKPLDNLNRIYSDQILKPVIAKKGNLIWRSFEKADVYFNLSTTTPAPFLTMSIGPLKGFINWRQ